MFSALYTKFYYNMILFLMISLYSFDNLFMHTSGS